MQSYNTEPGVSFTIGIRGQVLPTKGKADLLQSVRKMGDGRVMAINRQSNCVVSVRFDARGELVADYLPMCRKTIWSLMSAKEQARTDALDALNRNRRCNPKITARSAGCIPGTVKYHAYLIEFENTLKESRSTHMKRVVHH
ncbi:MAG: hypothetical protein ACR2PT_12875 [Endozoicomonas sp.]